MSHSLSNNGVINSVCSNHSPWPRPPLGESIGRGAHQERLDPLSALVNKTLIFQKSVLLAVFVQVYLRPDDRSSLLITPMTSRLYLGATIFLSAIALWPAVFKKSIDGRTQHGCGRYCHRINFKIHLTSTPRGDRENMIARADRAYA
jgi:hypothetical protein